MTSRVQTQRFAATATRPSNGTRPPGEFWLNFPDLRLGMIDPTKAAIDILPVRVYAVTATYAAGDYVVYQGQLQRAITALAPKTYAPNDWDPLLTRSTIAGQYLALTGGAMTGPLQLQADPTTNLQAATKQYADLKLALAGGTMTGALVLAADPTAPTQASTKRYVDNQLTALIPLASTTTPVMDGTAAVGTATTWARGDHRHPTDTSRVNKAGDTMTGNLTVNNGFVVAGFAVQSNSGRVVSVNASNPTVMVWDTAQSAAAGLMLGASNQLYLANLNGDGSYGGSWRAQFDASGNMVIPGQATIGGQGAIYTSYSGGHRFAFGWNGQVNLYVDGSYQGDIATTSLLNNTVGNYLPLTGGSISGNLGVNGALWSNGAFTAYAGLTVYGNAALTANAQVGAQLSVGTYLTVGNHGTVGDSGWYYSGTGAAHGFQFWLSGGGTGIICRVDNTTDFGLQTASDERLKQDIAPSTFDCLDMVRRTELYQFRYRAAPDMPLVPVGFIAQRQQELFPQSVMGELTYSIDPTIMLATLFGAVQALANEIDAIKAGAYA